MEENFTQVPMEYIEMESISDPRIKSFVKKYSSYFRLKSILSRIKESVSEIKTENLNSAIERSLWRSILTDYYLIFDKNSKGLSNVIEKEQIKKLLDDKLFEKHEHFLSIRKTVIAHIDKTDTNDLKFYLALEPENPNYIINFGVFDINLSHQSYKDFKEIDEIVDKLIRFIDEENEKLSGSILRWFQIIKYNRMMVNSGLTKSNN